MQIFKQDLMVVRLLVGQKNFSVPDFRLTIEDGVMKTSGICDERSWMFNYSQKVDTDEKLDVILMSSEFTRLMSVFGTSIELNFEPLDDILKVTSKSGGLEFNCRYAEWTTEPPEMDMDDDADDVLNIEFGDFKKMVGDMTTMESDEMTLSTDDKTMSSIIVNDMMSKLSNKILVDMVSGKGQEVTIDKGIVGLPLLKEIPIEMRISSVQPIRIKQHDDEQMLIQLLVPLIE